MKTTEDEHGNAAFEVVEGEVISVSPDGSIDRTRISGFFHCGHSTQEGIGGQCAEPGCQHVSCKQCFAQARCSRCFKPLCLEHLRQLKTETDLQNLCARCLADVKRQRFWRVAGRLVLKLFTRGEQ